MPTATLRFASNIGGGAWHNWNKGIAMATPIAYKGAAAGAKVQALTLLDFLLRPELVEAADDYYENVQTRDRQYETFLRPEDEPAIWLNRAIMERFRPQLRGALLRPVALRQLHGAARRRVPAARAGPKSLRPRVVARDSLPGAHVRRASPLDGSWKAARQPLGDAGATAPVRVCARGRRARGRAALPCARLRRHDQHAVDQDVLHALGVLVRPLEGGAIDYALRVEDGDVREEALAEQAAVLQADPLRGGAAHLADRLLQRQHASLPDVAAQDTRERAVLAGMGHALAEDRDRRRRNRLRWPGAA